MERSSATMPRTRYRALDFQQLTLPSRSTSPTSSNSSERRETLWPDFVESTFFCRRGRLRSQLFPPDQHTLELPNTYLPKTASRPALEQLRFGSSELAQNINFADHAPLLGKSTDAGIFLESDFPPLQRHSSTLSVLVDSGFEQRRITPSEAHHAQRNFSAPVPDSRVRSRKPTLRSIRYRDGGLDSQSSQYASLAPTGTEESSSVDVTIKSSRKDSILTLVEAEQRSTRNDMASAFSQMSGDARRHYPSGTPRYENRPPVNRATPCKNGPLCRKFQEGRIPFPILLLTISEAYRNQEHAHLIMTFRQPCRQQMDLACSFPSPFHYYHMLKPVP